MSKKDIGWNYLNSDDTDSIPKNDGDWIYESSDGSNTYYGEDGSWGYKNSDGSGSYYGADGSWGYKNSDGSGSYYGNDGTWGYTNADGTGSFYDSNGDFSSYESSHNDEDDDEKDYEEYDEIINFEVMSPKTCSANSTINFHQDKEDFTQKQVYYRANFKSNSFKYPECISSEDFEKIVRDAIKPIKKKIKHIEIENGKIHGIVTSISGLSDWTFTIDFTKSGRLVEKYKINSANADSLIPKRIAETVKDKIHEIISESDDYYYDEIRQSSKEEIRRNLQQLYKDEQKRNKAKKRKKWIQEHRLSIFVIVFIAVISLGLSVGYIEYQNYIPVGYTSKALVGLPYSEVVEKLREKGFTYVYPKEISDLPITKENEESLVTKIEFEDLEDFNENTKFHKNKMITIEYHTLKLYNAPLTSKDAKDMNYLDVIEKFESTGFINVKTNIEYDIITGWLTDDGSVESITINGTEDFDYYNDFRPDAEVVITYHTFKKNKPK